MEFSSFVPFGAAQEASQEEEGEEEEEVAGEALSAERSVRSGNGNGSGEGFEGRAERASDLLSQRPKLTVSEESLPEGEILDVSTEDFRNLLGPLSRSAELGTSGGSIDDVRKVGSVGEELALRALEAQGFEVLWVNSGSELGFPFDLIAIDRKDLTPGMPTLRSSVCDASGQPEADRLWELYQRARKMNSVVGSEFMDKDRLSSRVVFLEVKSSTGGKRAFETSLQEIDAMQALGSRYWLARPMELGSKRDGRGRVKPEVKLWRNFGSAVKTGAIQMLLVV
ncbi:unnamed protein product [Polarella glacialis]|uniref:Protein NO VEIN C-terminal domain-containing protein n=1 Tax=Polarella glacialis TaxID=89957 RepID=A0A813DQQ0_POLGL|nr:unnamed protein product [Polarella glacialis]